LNKNKTKGLWLGAWKNRKDNQWYLVCVLNVRHTIYTLY
jgi:hypothetical protein